MFVVCQHQGLLPIEFEDRCGQREKFGGSLGDGPGGRGGAKTKRLLGVRIQTEKGLGHLGWTGLFILLTPNHLSLRARFRTMRIKDEDFSLKVAEGLSHFAEGNLQPLCFRRNDGRGQVEFCETVGFIV